jgi:methionine-S-sulfoxide reductase
MKNTLLLLAMLTYIFASCGGGDNEIPTTPSPKPEEPSVTPPSSTPEDNTPKFSLKQKEYVLPLEGSRMAIYIKHEKPYIVLNKSHFIYQTEYIQKTDSTDLLIFAIGKNDTNREGIIVISDEQKRQKDTIYVKQQKTGHRETIRIDYDPSKVSFRELFNIFLVGVDPFDAGGQFIDRGFSYTLAVYYLSEDQKQMAENRIRKLEETSGQKVFISVEPFRNFYTAEEYHQNYDLKNPEAFGKELMESGRKKA